MFSHILKLLFVITCLSHINLVNAQTTIAVTTTPRPAACTSRYPPYYNGTCISAALCTGAVIEGRCSGIGNKCCIPDTTQPGPASNAILSSNQMAKVLGFQNTRTDMMSRYLYYPNTKRSCYNRATYVSVLAVKTSSFMVSEETGSDADFGKFDFLYGNNAIGDGGKYRARGFVMIKGKTLYERASIAINMPSLMQNPELAAFPSVASRIAAWYWNYRNYEPISDGTFVSFSQLIRLFFGGIFDLFRATAFLEKAATELKCGKIVTGHINSQQCSNKYPGALCKPLCVEEGKGKDYCGCNGDTVNDLCPGQPSNVKCCLEKCSGIMDLTFVLDSSGSITSSEFVKVRNFTGEVIKKLDIGESRTRVAIINFSNVAQIITNLSTTFDKQDLLRRVQNIPYLQSGTNTRQALEKCRDVIYKEENGMRPIETGVSKVIIVMTDGQSQDNPGPVAFQMKENNINLISIGVTNAINFQELEDIASFGKVFLLEDFDQVLFVIDDMLALSCKEPAVIPEVTDVIEVEERQFKYFRFSLDKINTSSLVVVAEQTLGKVDIFYSFDDRNPNDYEITKPSQTLEIDPLSDNATYVKPKLESFQDMLYSPSGVRSRMSPKKTSTKKVTVPIPKDSNYTDIYIGIKGLQPVNEFKLEIKNTAGARLGASAIFFLITLFISILAEKIF